MTVDENAPIATIRYGKAGIAVVVRWTETFPSGPRPAGTAQRLRNRLGV